MTAALSIDLLTCGEALAVLIAEQDGPLHEAATFRRHVAGAECNVAVGVSRLGLKAAFIGRIGDDGFGRAVLARLRGEGVDTSGVIVDAAAPTGLLLRERRQVGAPAVLYHRRGSAGSRLVPEDLPASRIAASRWLHLSGVTAAISPIARATIVAAAQAARAAGVTVSFDPNHRRKLWSDADAKPALRELALLSDVLLPGADELELITGLNDLEAGARSLLAAAPTLRLVVVKLGAEGCLAVERSGVLRGPSKPLPRVVDAVGAGDGFAAGFIAGRLKGLELAPCLALANRCGALATTAWGDTEAMPTWAEAMAELPAAGDVLR